jgi:hypothetical protein
VKSALGMGSGATQSDPENTRATAENTRAMLALTAALQAGPADIPGRANSHGDPRREW